MPHNGTCDCSEAQQQEMQLVYWASLIDMG
jgi:hypothetical protein